MDRDIDLITAHFDEKIKKKQAISTRRPISHIDAFYGSHNQSGGVIGKQSSLGLINKPDNNESVLNLNSLISRA